MMTFAMAEMMALMPPPMAETIEPCVRDGQQLVTKKDAWRRTMMNV